MKKYFFILSFSISILVQLVAGKEVPAQSGPSSPGGVENKIKQVEESLGGWVRTQDHTSWNLKERMDYYKIRGLSIAVIHNYKLEWAKGYDWADIDKKIPVTTKTLFQVSSVGLSLNAMGVLKLVQDKKIDLSSDINTFLNTWKFPYDSLSKNKKITVANLLSHTAGLGVQGFPGYAAGDSIPTLVQVLDGQKPAITPPVRSIFEPGLRFEYSDGGTLISQLIVMDVTHQPYEKYMEENVLKPLDMTGSFYGSNPTGKKQKLLSSAYEEDGRLVKGNFHTYPELAPAGLWTNPTDLAKFIIETQLAYQGKSNKILSPENTRLALTPFPKASAGLGTFVFKKGEATYFHHFGRGEGFTTLYYGSLDGGDGVVVMVNSDNAGILEEIANSVATVYDWKGFYKPETKKVVSLSLEQLKPLEGKYKYQFVKGKDDYLQIKAAGNKLIIKQSWDGNEFTFVPESESDFFSIDERFPLTFKKDKDGSVNQVLAFNRDLWNRVTE